MSTLTGPPPISTNPLVKLVDDVRRERTARTKHEFPPGQTRFSMRRTQRFAHDPLRTLLDAYALHGPVFTLRILHQSTVFVLGPQANHRVLVSNAANYSWRRGHFSDLVPLLGDGLLTIDGDFHRSSRRIMLPAFHKEQIAASREVMELEARKAVEGLRPGQDLDLYEWTRELAMTIAMRALFGFDTATAARAAHDFEEALAFYSRDYLLQVARGPGSPFQRMQTARKRLDALVYAEIERRRRSGERGPDLLSLLLDARDETGQGLSDAHVRDEVTTLLFAGHDTTTSTIAFLFYELARNPHERDADLDLLLDETLRLYPPAWVGPRRSLEPDVICGMPIPADAPVNYVSWVSHRLPDVWEDPDRFDPGRFAPGRRERIPKGAYVPFGGGSRTCLGMRFGQAEIAVIARLLRERFTLTLQPGYTLRIRQMPTLSPRDGMPMRLGTA